MSLEVPFDDIPAEHFLGRLLRQHFIAVMRNHLEEVKRLAEAEYAGHDNSNIFYKEAHGPVSERIKDFMKIRFDCRMDDYKIRYMGKSTTSGREQDDVFFIIPITGVSTIFGKIRIRGGLIGHSTIKPHEVEFKFPSLRGDNWFTVGPSTRKQQLNRDRSTAAVMAATRPETAHLVGLTKPLDPYLAAAYIAPMLGANGQAVTDTANARDAALNAARIAALPEPASHWSNNVNLSSITVRKSRKRTRARKLRTRRH
jgi:hypothetical protein